MFLLRLRVSCSLLRSTLLTARDQRCERWKCEIARVSSVPVCVGFKCQLCQGSHSFFSGNKSCTGPFHTSTGDSTGPCFSHNKTNEHSFKFKLIDVNINKLKQRHVNFKYFSMDVNTASIQLIIRNKEINSSGCFLIFLLIKCNVKSHRRRRYSKIDLFLHTRGLANI